MSSNQATDPINKSSLNSCASGSESGSKEQKDSSVSFETKEDGTKCMTILFPPDPPPDDDDNEDDSSGKRKRKESQTNGSTKVVRTDPTIIEIRLCDSDDEEDSLSSPSADTSRLSSPPPTPQQQEQLTCTPRAASSSLTPGGRQGASTSSPAALSSPTREDQKERQENAANDGEEVEEEMYDSEMTESEVRTMIQRCRVLLDFFAAGQLPHGRSFGPEEIRQIRSNVSLARFFANRELDRLFKQVLLIPQVTAHFSVLVETVATIFYSEEEVRRDFLPHHMARPVAPARAYLGKPLRHHRAFQRIFMLFMGFRDPVEFDRLNFIRRVSKELVQVRKHGFPSATMMAFNRSAAFKL